MKRLVLVALVFLSALPIHAAQDLAVAGAANLVFALEDLNGAFRRSHPDITLTATTGASGNLVAQISNGAPIDVFLSADVEYPQALIKRDQAEAGSFFVFATGQLVLWSTKPGIVTEPVATAVRAASVQRIAIANTETAPYGRAARQTLEKLGLWAEVQPRLVTGENITQTAQFVETGNADLGFVAKSLVLAPNLKEKGHWTEVPADLYAPLDQGVVITKRGAGNPAATRYLQFLRSPEARKILERFGYRVPASP